MFQIYADLLIFVYSWPRTKTCLATLDQSIRVVSLSPYDLCVDVFKAKLPGVNFNVRWLEFPQGVVCEELKINKSFLLSNIHGNHFLFDTRHAYSLSNIKGNKRIRNNWRRTRSIFTVFLQINY